ncbi:MAG: hypothetical protein E3K32_12125 [wastewater metagenome]|nr:hypothetical protein [Candidatus Loosdrechtia aerotolerans]
MKRVTALVKPRTVYAAKNYFKLMGYPVLKIAYIRDGQQSAARTVFWRGEEYVVDLISHAKIEVILIDEDVDEVVSNIDNLLYEKDGNNGEYEYALRLKSEVIQEGVTTEKGRWVRMQPKEELNIDEIPEKKPLEVTDVYA